MSSRDAILGGIKRSILKSGQREDETTAKEAVEARIAAKKINILPKRSQKPQPDLVVQFVKELEAVQGTCTQLSDTAEIPKAVAAFLREHNLPSTLKIAPDEELRALDWQKSAPLIEVTEGRADGSEATSLSTAVNGISETGTLVLHSEAKRPTTLNFLPEHHIVVLKESEIIGAYEQGFETLCEANPRTINMITGPSRTGDIEQTLYLGAHGPRKLHVLLVA